MGHASTDIYKHIYVETLHFYSLKYLNTPREIQNLSTIDRTIDKTI